MSNLTAEQVDALTHAWLDLSATNEMLNGDDPIDRRAWDEIAEATKDSVKKIETAFPFLLEILDDE